MNLKILILTILIASVVSCKKEDPCPVSKDLGSLIWSDETKNWIPFEYFEMPHSLKYISEDNEEKTFNLDISELVGSLSWTTEVECENGEGTTNFRYKAERYTGRFTTSDSLWIFFGLGVRNEILAINDRTEVDFYEWVSMSIHNANDATIDYDYGDVYIVTDMRNAELGDLHRSIKNGITCGRKTFFSLDCGIKYFSNIASSKICLFWLRRRSFVQQCAAVNCQLLLAIDGCTGRYMQFEQTQRY